MMEKKRDITFSLFAFPGDRENTLVLCGINLLAYISKRSSHSLVVQTGSASHTAVKSVRTLNNLFHVFISHEIKGYVSPTARPFRQAVLLSRAGKRIPSCSSSTDGKKKKSEIKSSIWTALDPVRARARMTSAAVFFCFGAGERQSRRFFFELRALPSLRESTRRLLYKTAELFPLVDQC